MQLVDGRLVFSASDLVGHLYCEHLTQLELQAAHGTLARPNREDPELALLARRGLDHEKRELDRRRATGARVASLDRPEERAPLTLSALRDGHERTVAAMREGADVIYQAAFFDGRWLGYADFLERVERPSALGDWSYEVADTKLARSVRASAVLQLATYAGQVGQVQGIAPERIHVITGDRRRQSLTLADVAAYERAVRTRFEAAVDGPARETYPEPVEHCGVCRWAGVCDAKRRADDHLTLVANLTSDQTRKLRLAGIGTLTELAVTPLAHVAKIGDETLAKLREQARMQLEQKRTNKVFAELRTPEPGRGFALLPTPSKGDVFFDMEGDPFFTVDDSAEDPGGLEYLFGVVTADTGAPVFTAFWGHDRVQEKRAFEGLVDFLVARLDADPAMHVYHYASYERTALSRLAQRHGTREAEIDRLLRGETLVDLYRVVQQGVLVSQESYSIKKLEPLYMAAREAAIKDAGSSVVAYEEWLEDRDAARLEAIAAYNEEDCVSTMKLRDWLEGQREEAIVRFGPIARPEIPTGVPSEAQSKDDAETVALADRLRIGLPEDPAADTPGQHAQRLLIALLSFHRREQRPEWWEYYHRLTLTEEQLVDDTASIGGLVPTSNERPVRRSKAREYEFDPTQEHKFEAGDTSIDPRTGGGAGAVEAIDNAVGLIELTLGPSFKGHPTAIVPNGPINNKVLREGVRAIAAYVADHGLEGPGPYRAVRELLRSGQPRLRDLVPGASLARAGEHGVDAVRRLASLLDETVLAVQGPPGTGKTYAGAQAIIALVAAGKRVGICAHSHRAIVNLIDATVEAAASGHKALRIVQKADNEDISTSPGVVAVQTYPAASAAIAAGVDVVAGTAWLFAQPALTGAVDVLVIDEAGQLALADVVAIGGAASSFILLGDPNQLHQPTKARHPDGAGRSALEHVLDGKVTIPAERGIFLEQTRRMHPDLASVVSELFYDGRLATDEGCAVQRVGGDGQFSGTGLRFVPVEHTGNRTTSPEEVDRVRAIVAELVGREWTDREGRRRPLALADILIVAPYNAHVARLRERLPKGARVGTVDKFQGQEAPVVIYSMATSTREDIPRGMEFLYDRHRLNVALSRAQGLAVVVASPALEAVRCKTPEQIVLASRLCRIVEGRSGP